LRTILTSIQPIWLAKIFAGTKNVEVRLTEPDTVPFKSYIYCSKGKEKLLHIIRDGDDCYGQTYHGSPIFVTLPEDMYSYQYFRQAVVGEFTCKRVTRVTKDTLDGMLERGELEGCRFGMTEKEFRAYMGDKTAHLWHLSDVKTYRYPKELSAFHRPCPESLNCEGCAMHALQPVPHCGNYALEIRRPPQSWCYAEDQT